MSKQGYSNLLVSKVFLLFFTIFGTSLGSGFLNCSSYSETKCYKSHARGEMSFQLLPGESGGWSGEGVVKSGRESRFSSVFFTVFSIR